MTVIERNIGTFKIMFSYDGIHITDTWKHHKFNFLILGTESFAAYEGEYSAGMAHNEEDHFQVSQDIMESVASDYAFLGDLKDNIPESTDAIIEFLLDEGDLEINSAVDLQNAREVAERSLDLLNWVEKLSLTEKDEFESLLEVY